MISPLNFDPEGRRIPSDSDRVYRKVSRHYFKLKQPEINYQNIYDRTKKYLKTMDLPTASEFKAKAEQILENLKKDPSTANLTHGIHIPFLCAKETPGMNMTQELEKIYLTAVGESFVEKFPKYKFTNYCEGTLTGTQMVPGSRYENFLDSHKKSYVVGWYFPNCLSEFAVPDQRAQMNRLPKNLILSGGIDAAAAFIGTPEILMKTDDNLYPHLLCLSALQPPQKEFFYHFEAYGWNLTFNQRSYIGAVAEYWAGGLTVIE